MNSTQQYIRNNKDRYLNELIDLLKIPSISADPKYKDEVKKMADATANALKTAGCKKVKIYPTKGHPIVYGEHIIDKKKPTVMVYGHYDVQPPDPLELWESPPFEPVVKKTKTHPRWCNFCQRCMR